MWPRTSFLATREISVFRIDATFGMDAIVECTPGNRMRIVVSFGTPQKFRALSTVE